MFYTRLDTKFCELILVGDQAGLKKLHMDTGEGSRNFSIDPSWVRNDIFFRDIIAQLKAYEAGDLKTFDVQLNPDGTPFQKTVWQALRQIPYGEVVTYKDIGIKLGRPTASRAIGSANGKNPIPIIVPCHRVIGSNGQLTGFAFGLDVKKTLIEHEKANG